MDNNNFPRPTNLYTSPVSECGNPGKFSSRLLANRKATDDGCVQCTYVRVRMDVVLYRHGLIKSLPFSNEISL